MAFSLHTLATGELACNLLGLSVSCLVVWVVLGAKLSSLLQVGKTSSLVLLAGGLPRLRASDDANGGL